MTILYHHRTLVDGAEGIHITEMIRAFEALGHQVVTCAPGSTRGRPGRLPSLVRRALPQGLFECAAAAHSTIERRQGRQLLERVHPAFVYKRHALNDFGMLEAARDRGVPSVLEVNALYSSDALQKFEPLRFRRLARTLEARALRLATFVVAVSSPMRALIEQLAKGSRVLTLPNGVDPVQFSPSVDGSAIRRKYGLDTSQLVVGWSGIVRSWHGLDLVLKSLAYESTAVLLVIGDGPYRKRIQDDCIALGLGQRVKFTGYVERGQMAEHLAAIDIGLVADDRTGYASPMKLLEYMAMGTAVVAPDLANIRDIVTDGTEGLLFQPGNAQSLASCLERLGSADLREALGRRARARVVEERNWLANARSVLEAVAGLAAPRHVRVS
jgi:glycosyltransferase involved in cell wall biosynthesis